MAELTKTSLCLAVALVLAACADVSGRAAGDSSSQAPPAPSPQAAATPADRAGAAATVTPAPTGRSSTTNPATAPPSSTPPEPTAGPTETAEPDDPSPSPSDSPSEPSQRELLEAEVVELTNAERAAAGCPEVRVHDRLVAAARGHSEDMVERDFFDHTNPDGDGPGARARAAGYDWLAISENIAWGHRTAEDVVAGWMDSPGHRQNMLNCDVVDIGVGVADSGGGPYWTQMFGRS